MPASPPAPGPTTTTCPSTSCAHPLLVLVFLCPHLIIPACKKFCAASLERGEQGLQAGCQGIRAGAAPTGHIGNASEDMKVAGCSR